MANLMADKPRTQCLDLQPRLAAFALGEIEADDELLAHLRTCKACMRDLHSYTRVARALPHEDLLATPPARLREHIVAAVAEPAPVPPPRPPVPQRRRQAPWLRQLATGFVFAALVALLFWNIALQQQLSEARGQVTASRSNWRKMITLLNSSDVRWYEVSGGGTRGHLWILPDNPVGCFVVQGLPTPPDGQVYQIWLLQENTWVSGGTFETREGNGWVLVEPGAELDSYTAVALTIEPPGGSSTPTSQNVLHVPLSQAHTPLFTDRQLALNVMNQAAR